MCGHDSLLSAVCMAVVTSASAIVLCYIVCTCVGLSPAISTGILVYVSFQYIMYTSSSASLCGGAVVHS